jgi:hypothetical protein
MVLRPSPRPSVLALSRTRSRGRRCHFWCSISPTPRRGRDASRGPVDPPHPVRRAPAGALIDRVDKRQLLTACDISGVARTSCWAPSRCFVASPPPRRRAIPDGGTLALGGFAIGRRRRREREVDRRARPPAGPRRLLRMPPILQISAAQLAPLAVRNVMHEIGDGLSSRHRAQWRSRSRAPRNRERCRRDFHAATGLRGARASCR